MPTLGHPGKGTTVEPPPDLGQGSREGGPGTGAGFLGPWNCSVGPLTGDSCPVRPEKEPSRERPRDLECVRHVRLLRTEDAGAQWARAHSTRPGAFHSMPQDARIRGGTAPGLHCGSLRQSASPTPCPTPATAGCRQCGATGEPWVGLAFATTLPSPRQPEGRPLHGRRGLEPSP